MSQLRPESQSPRSRTLKLRLGLSLLVVWFVIALIGIGSFSVSHSVPMPEIETRMTQALFALRQRPERALLVHVIYADCSCTERLFAHLIARGPFAGSEENILYVGQDQAKQAAAERRGFGFKAITAQALAENYALESAPVLLAFDRAGSLRYAGGYYDRPAAQDPLDESIHRRLMQGKSVAGLPVFGCAVSARLQQRVDPLGIVYRE